MRKGMLSKPELKIVVRQYRDLEKLIAKVPEDPTQLKIDSPESNTRDCLVTARNKLGELLRWQDFGGAYQEAIKPASPKGHG